MLLIVRLPQSEVIEEAERAHLEGLVGPTSPGGWTALWCEDSTSLELAAPFLVVDEASDALSLLVRADDGGLHRRTWPSRRGADPSDPPHQVAAALAALFERADRQPDLVRLLERDLDDTDELVAALGGPLDLPELQEQPPARTAVGFRGRHEVAELAASIAGPAYLSAGVGGWTTLLLADEGHDRTLELAAGLSGAAGRRDVVLSLWRDDTACGVQLWRRGRPEVSWSWSGGWSTVSADPIADQSEAARQLARLSAGPVEEDHLRALLRRRFPDGDPLAELANLLGLPGELLEALDRPDGFREQPDVSLRERVPARRAVLARAAGPDLSQASRRVRAAWWLYAVGTAVAAAVCVAMAALSVAVLVTDGSVTGRRGATAEDWLWLVAFVALAAVLIATARVRFRRLKNRP